MRIVGPESVGAQTIEVDQRGVAEDPVRFDRGQYTWRSGSSQLLRRRQLAAGSVLFHVGIVLLFFGHFFGLLTPQEVYRAIGLGAGAKQMLAIVASGLIGAVCLVGLTMLMRRRLECGRGLASGASRRVKSRGQAPRSDAEQGAVAMRMIKSCRMSP